MRDARDAEDERLLAEGEVDRLLAGWVETIQDICVAKMRGPVGEDVAQAVCERLWRELKAGRHCDGRYPFRVIVHSVTRWVCKGWYEPGWQESELFDLDGAAPDESEAVVVEVTLEQFVATLPDELVRRHARGEPLDVEGTLRRAGDDADELAPLIEAFLARAPRRGPTPASLRFVQSLDDPPMLRARVAKALKVDDVVDAIVAECELAPEARPRVRRYYQQLEGGILDPTRVAASVWDVLTGLLGRSRALLSAPAGPAPAAAPMYRTHASFDLQERLVTLSSPEPPSPPDEVDAL